MAPASSNQLIHPTQKPPKNTQIAPPFFVETKILPWFIGPKKKSRHSGSHAARHEGLDDDMPTIAPRGALKEKMGKELGGVLGCPWQLVNGL